MPKKKNSAEPYFAPGQDQGQLARPAFFMQPSERYPRGYTPERQREVHEALSDTQFYGRGMWDVGKAEAAKVRETISRSTVPTEDLRHLHSIGVRMDLQGGDWDTGPARATDYWGRQTVGEFRNHPENDLTTTFHPRSQIELGATMLAKGHGYGSMFPERDASDAQYMGQTLIHEIGHHVQNQRLLDWSGKYGKKTGRDPYWDGIPEEDMPKFATKWHAIPKHAVQRLEADAENYADKHFREDRRLPKASELETYDRQFADQPKAPYWKVRNKPTEQPQRTTLTSNQPPAKRSQQFEQLGLF